MAKKRSLVIGAALLAVIFGVAIAFVVWLAPGRSMTGGGGSSAGSSGGGGISAASGGGGISAFAGGFSFRAMAMVGTGLAVCFLLAAAVVWLMTNRDGPES